MTQVSDKGDRAYNEDVRNFDSHASSHGSSHGFSSPALIRPRMTTYSAVKLTPSLEVSPAFAGGERVVTNRIQC